MKCTTVLKMASIAALALAGCGGFYPVVVGPPKPGQETVVQMVLDQYDAGHLEHPIIQWLPTDQLDCKTGPNGYVPMAMGTGEGWTKRNPTRCVYGDTVTRHLPGGIAKQRWLRLVWRKGYTTAADAAGTLTHEIAHYVWEGDGGHQLPHWKGQPSRVEQARDAIFDAYPGSWDRAVAAFALTAAHEEETEE